MRFVLLGCLLFSTAVPAFGQGWIVGRVLDAGSDVPLPGASVRLAGTSQGAAADGDGRFEIGPLPTGHYAVAASMVGFETATHDSIGVRAGDRVTLTVRLRERPAPLREVVVTPGRFDVLRAEAGAAQTLSRDELQGRPQLAEDLFRAVRRLPGLSGSDFSAAFGIRGGTHDHVLVQLDGMPLYDPFHLKDLGGGLSVVDVEAIGGIDLMTGAFPVRYGDRLSGVFDIRSSVPQRRRTAVGLSLTNARLLTEGPFHGGRGTWLVLARRGYVDIALQFIDPDEDLSPRYYDVFAKATYALGRGHRLGAHVLHAGDRLELAGGQDLMRTRHGNSYGWLTLASVLGPRLLAETVLFAGDVGHDRFGEDVSSHDGQLNARVDDGRGFAFGGLRQDWTLEAADDHLLVGGFDVRRLDADYDYTGFSRISGYVLPTGAYQGVYDTTSVALAPGGWQQALYAGHRWRLARTLTAEWGLRLARTTWSGERRLSPRLNVAYAPRPATVLRLGWGFFAQAHGLHRLDVADGDAHIHPSEVAEHRVLGVEHAFGRGLLAGFRLRAEAYWNLIPDPRPGYVNMEAQSMDFFPEVQDDRLPYAPERASLRGLELMLRKDVGARFSGWASYSLAVAEDVFTSPTADGDGPAGAVPRPHDQRHTFFLDGGYRIGQRWRLSAAWQIRSGWPYTPYRIERRRTPGGRAYVEHGWGGFRSARFPAYHRLDVRAHRYFTFERSRLGVFVEIANVYGRKNVRGYWWSYDWNPRTERLRTTRHAEHWLPRIPSVGVSWEVF